MMSISSWSPASFEKPLPHISQFLSTLLWMNEKDTYIPPTFRLINPISMRSTTNQRFKSDELPTWVEQSHDLMIRSTVYFLIVTYSGTFLSFNHLSNCIFLCLLFFLAIYALHAGYLFVTDTLSTPTISEPPRREWKRQLCVLPLFSLYLQDKFSWNLVDVLEIWSDGLY